MKFSDLFIGGVLITIIGMIAYALITNNDVTVAENPTPSVTATSTDTVLYSEEDVIDRAQRELERIKAELEEKENNLLERRKQENTRHQEALQEIDAELDRITKIRVSL